MQFQPDEIIHGKYRIEALIGEGAFGQVYRVTHMQLNQWMALKILRKDKPGVSAVELEQCKDRFQLEAKLGARFADHPNVIHVYDFEQKEDSLILVMEYAAGGSLAERLENAQKRNQKVPIRTALNILTEVAQGLAVLHNQDIVHRDLKPSNILFDKDGHAKVSDLGLAQIPHRASSRLTKQSQPQPHPGTPPYMSPEQKTQSGYLRPASDIYTMGLILFEMLTGRCYHNLRPGTRLREFRPDVPGWLDKLTRRMLDPNPEKRPWDGGELLRLLQEGRPNDRPARRPLRSCALSGLLVGLLAFACYITYNFSHLANWFNIPQSPATAVLANPDQPTPSPNTAPPTQIILAPPLPTTAVPTITAQPLTEGIPATSVPTTVAPPPTKTPTFTPSPSPTPSGTLFWDTFDTGIRPEWRIEGKNYSMTNGKLAANGSMVAAIGDTTWTNYAVDVSGFDGSSNRTFRMRYQDQDNYIYWECYHSHWVKVSAGKGQDIPAATLYCQTDFRIEVVGNLYKILNTEGALLLTFTDNSTSSGGIAFTTDSNLSLNSIKVSPLTTPPQTYGAVPSDLLFLDEFTFGIRPEWRIEGKNYSMTNGKLAANGSMVAAIGDTTWTNYAVDVSGFDGSSNRIFRMRYQDQDNYIYWECYHSHWVKVSAGKGQDIPAATLYCQTDFRIEVVGNLYKILNTEGALLLTFTDNSTSSGGIAFTTDSNLSLNSIKVSPLTAAVNPMALFHQACCSWTSLHLASSQSDGSKGRIARLNYLLNAIFFSGGTVFEISNSKGNFLLDRKRRNRSHKIPYA